MKDFPWRAGMLALWPGQWARIVAVSDDGWVSWMDGECPGDTLPPEAQPDPTDGATLGALLAAVRETMGPSRPGSANGYCAQEIGLLVARYLIGAESPEKVFAALLATWEARPR